ncbi:MAG: DUF2306 domain-containing protein [Chloroflexales bacterium]|nr:DUF2306 domain-containing protein [Chloroflexales bacterium]
MQANALDEGHAPDEPQRTERGKPRRPGAPAKAGSAKWVVAGLFLLSAIPLAGGAFRLSQLAGGAEVTPDNARFFAAPLPVVLHIVSVTLYALLGAFQFVPSLRRRRHGWHRAAGLLVIPSGLLAALSGLWMTLFYRMPAHDGALVYGLRLLFGSAMLLSILLGVVALRRRAFVQHGHWMLRGYAIGMGAGTQVLTGMVAAAFADPPTELSRALLMGAGWVINLAVAEWIIRRRPARPVRTAAAV